jgi:hypothetical protein
MKAKLKKKQKTRSKKQETKNGAVIVQKSSKRTRVRRNRRFHMHCSRAHKNSPQTKKVVVMQLRAKVTFFL